MQIKKWFVVTVCFAISLHAFAGYINGNKLLADLNSPAMNSVAIGYVTGVVDASISSKAATGQTNLLPTCFEVPPAVTAGQLGDIVKLWLQRNPQHRHFSAASLTAAALGENYPCAP